MSVVELLNDPKVCILLDSVIPPFPKRIFSAIAAPPVTNRYSLVGTAFDYAIRFELELLYPHARTETWVAETGAAAAPPKQRKKARRILDAAKADFESYVRNPTPDAVTRATMAAHAIRLAKLDLIFRPGIIDPAMDVADPGDVQDILQLLAVAPCATLAHPTTLCLNPSFGALSSVVGGADCDLISGNALIEIKVTKDDNIRASYVRQLVSYLILARGARKEDTTFPEIHSIGVYFARHAYLWTLPVESIMGNPQFSKVEGAYLDYAQGVYGIPLEMPQSLLLKRRKKKPVAKKATRQRTTKRAKVKPRGKRATRKTAKTKDRKKMRRNAP